jgi:hypothetical protein
MKRVSKYLSFAVLSGILCLFFTFNANAQHDHSSGGGGGGSRSSGGGGGASHVSVAPPRSAPSVRSTQPRTYSAPRQNTIVQRNGVTQRSTYSGRATIGVTAQSYRTYQGSAYGRNHLPGNASVTAYSKNRGYWANTGNYHYNHGYYGSYYAPRLGFSIGFLPYGYYPFYFGDYQYFYSDGLFYQYNNDQYTVVEPPVGAEVTTLPSNAQSIVINGQQYYEVDGVYYQPITKDDGTLSYQVAGKDGELNTGTTDPNGDPAVDNNAPAPLQMGDLVNTLPDGCRKVTVNGDKLYISPDGVYFKAQLDDDNNKVYKVVGLPSDDEQPPANQQ